MDLSDVHQLVIPEIQENLAIVASGDQMCEIGGVFAELSAYFQALGICHLLEFADLEQFQSNLVRSGYARRYFLRKSSEQGNKNSSHLAISRSEAFLDAVGAGDLPLAREIVALSTPPWDADWEYEDDFCYYQFLHSLVLAPDNLPETQMQMTLQRFQDALEGGDSWRLEVCKSLLARDEEVFHEAFQELIEEIRDFQDSKKTDAEPYEFLVWPRSYVSVEGLALLEAAKLLGIPTSDGYPLCPPMARLSTADLQVADPFQEIEVHLTS